MPIARDELLGTTEGFEEACSRIREFLIRNQGTAFTEREIMESLLSENPSGPGYLYLLEDHGRPPSEIGTTVIKALVISGQVHAGYVNGILYFTHPNRNGHRRSA